MRTILRLSLTIAACAAIACPDVVQGGPALTEETALDLLVRTLKERQVYKDRISLDCVTFSAEEKSKGSFQFVLRENHNTQCGGDPAVSPVVDRYRVRRASKKIERYDVVNDRWQPF